MLTKTEPPQGDGLAYPFAEAPATGAFIEVAPGILWIRIPLPFRLDHVNIYLIEDGDGWAVLDTGIANQATRDVWEGLVAGPLAGRRLTRLIVTHFHPDHIGLAGWLCERYGLPLLTSQTCYLGCINISLSPNSMGDKTYRDFYRSHGMADETADLVATQGNGYLRMVSPLPPMFSRLVAGDTLVIGGRRFEVMSGDGHAAEQLMLYLRSLHATAIEIPDDALVLPGHQLPFRRLHTRISQLAAHHAERCSLLAQACAEGPKSVADLVPVLFPRKLDPHQLSFAFSETHAHVNYMVRRGELAWEKARADLMRVRPG